MNMTIVTFLDLVKTIMQYEENRVEIFLVIHGEQQGNRCSKTFDFKIGVYREAEEAAEEISRIASWYMRDSFVYDRYIWINQINAGDRANITFEIELNF